MLTALAFGFFANRLPQGVSAWEGSRFVLFFFVQMLSYSLIAFLISVLIKRAGLAMGIFFIYMIIEQVVVLILKNKYNVTGGNYFPEEVTDKLIPFPYIKSMITGQGGADWERHIPVYLLVAAIYVLIYCLFVSRRFLKSDL
jgi:ABC-2 type transport system permease protein